MYNHCINKLLDIKEVKVKRVEHADSFVKIYLETPPSLQKCPACGLETRSVHDYRRQIVKDLPFQHKHCFLILKKRRYACKCGKRFYEHYSFLPRYLQRTGRLTAYIAASFQETVNISSVAKRANVSTATVGRILDTISFPSPYPKMPKVLSIDEFKGNADKRKYQCILVDPVKHRVLDILQDREVSYLIPYFRSIPPFERRKVKFFVCDMYRNYAALARQFFPNAQVVIDKYHFIRQTSWAIESVRKRLQAGMRPDLRRYYKRSRSLILTRYSKLRDEKKRECDLMLFYSEELRKAHWLKEEFFSICQNPKYSEQRRDFWDWIREAEKSGIPEFKACASTYRNWAKEILAAFKHGNITNGPTEGFNNKIKVLKRSSYGIRRFDRFRTRIMMTTN